MMHLSDSEHELNVHSKRRYPHLLDNVVVAYKTEPASGGFFVVKPNLTDYDQLLEIIHWREVHAVTNMTPQNPTGWDPVLGWGHTITPPDYWSTTKSTNDDNHLERATKWTWYVREDFVTLDSMLAGLFELLDFSCKVRRR
jgi:hypothetical protein